MPLNGAAANTEGGRLQRKIATMGPGFIPRLGNADIDCCIPRNSIQYPITQSENSRTSLLTATANGTTLVGAGVTQERAKELLAMSIKKQYGSEGLKTAALQQKTLAAAPNPQLLPPIVIQLCPPTPAPPALPARACPPTKNTKLGS